MPDIDDLVRVVPAPALKRKGYFSGVLKTHDRFLANEGEDLPWTPFLHERHRTGEIQVVPPAADRAREDLTAQSTKETE